MITPVFTSHYSLGTSLLTLEEPGKAKAGGPVSVFTLAAQAKLKEVCLVEDRCDGFIEAYKTAAKCGVKLCYSVRFVVVPDFKDKTVDSARAESRVTVMVRNTQGYHDLLRLWSRAWTEGHFTNRRESYGRLDWATLKAYWTPNLMLGLPYFSSCVAVNTLTFAKVVPDLPPLGDTPLFVFKEVDSGLPFAPLIDNAIDRFVAARSDIQVVPSKTIYYRSSSDLKTYIVRRAIGTRSSWDKPEVDHLASDRFSFEDWMRAAGGEAAVKT